MIPHLRDLYQEVILDHSKRPRNRRKVDSADREACGMNPLCGDKLRVFIKVEDGRIRDIGFEGDGCAISTASASMMTENLKGKTVDEARAMFTRFHDLLTAQDPGVAVSETPLGKLEVFSGVREFPVRVKCATLAWHTLKAALENQTDVVTSE